MLGVFYTIPIALSVVIGTLYYPSRSQHVTPAFWNDYRPRVLLLTAHPDDEAFFFGPTLTALTQDQTGSENPIEVFSLCLSIGDADGLGATRVTELSVSLELLGVKNENRWVLDDESLKDDITKFWDPNLVANAVRPYVENYNITTIMTFDAAGVSLHPNHRSLFHGVRHLLSDPETHSHLRAYSLVSVPTTIKYISLVAALQAKYSLAMATASKQGVLPFTVFVASASQWWTIARAFISHGSQLVWFRWLYLIFSRYLWVNEWMPISRDP